jgi:hypothetical protein
VLACFWPHDDAKRRQLLRNAEQHPGRSAADSLVMRAPADLYGSVSVSLRRFWVDCRQDRFRRSGDSLRIWPLRRALLLTCPRVAGPAWPTALT